MSRLKLVVAVVVVTAAATTSVVVVGRDVGVAMALSWCVRRPPCVTSRRRSIYGTHVF